MITFENQLRQDEMITVRQAYETLKNFDKLTVIGLVMISAPDYEEESQIAVDFDVTNSSQICTLLAIYGDFLVDQINFIEKSSGSHKLHFFIKMTNIVWGKPIRKTN